MAKAQTFVEDPRILEAATYGLKWEANKQGLNLHTYNVERLAENALCHARGTGRLVDRSNVDDAVSDERARTAQWKTSFFSAERQRDQMAGRVQRALSNLDDKELAARLASECGVMLLPERD